MESVSGENQDLNQEAIFLTNACLYDTPSSNFISIGLQYIEKTALPLNLGTLNINMSTSRMRSPFQLGILHKIAL